MRARSLVAAAALPLVAAGLPSVACAQETQPMTQGAPARDPEGSASVAASGERPIALDASAWQGVVAPRFETQSLADEGARKHWRSSSGELFFDGAGPAIESRASFGDVEINFEWRIGPAAIVEVWVRGAPAVRLGVPPEGTGSVRGEREWQPALSRPSKSVGQWNTARVIDRAGRLWVEINGQPTAIDAIAPPGRPATGPIRFSAGAAQVTLRNLRVRELPPAAPRFAITRGERLAICGDSITEQQAYSRFVETYLRVCQPQLEVTTFQFGWGGERAPQFADRLARDVRWWKPTAATVFYGMNDGSYRPFTPEIGAAYVAGLTRAVEGLGAMGARVVVATPGRVDPDTFANPNATPEQYNANLAELRERARALAWERGLGVADVNAWMGAAIDAGKGALGVYYDVAGPDGVHPRENGHLAIALAMLQGLGVDGTIARIEWDPASGSASASEGHRVIASSPTALELESTRYPFGFWGDPRSADGTRGMAQLIPFNTLVNRFELVVKNAPPRARLWWGTDAVVITADRLARGVNLAELFTRYPTDEQFFVVDAAVGRKQALEREIVKLKMPAMKNVESERAPLEKLWKKMDEEAKAAVRPVRHTIRIEPVE